MTGLAVVADASQALAATRSRKGKVERLAHLLRNRGDNDQAGAYAGPGRAGGRMGQWSS
jgi:hypothetical protein